MKKIIPSILIALILLQLFAPFNVGLNNKNIKVESNKAEAANNGIKVTATAETTDTAIQVNVRVVWENSGLRTGNQGVGVTLLNGDTIESKVNVSAPVTNLTNVDKANWTAGEIGADSVQT